MTMLTEVKFSDARANLTGVIDSVQNLIPMVIKPRKSSETNTIMLSQVMLGILLNNFKFDLDIIVEDDESFTLSLDTLELYVNAKTKESAMAELVEDVLGYAQRYIQNPAMYLNAPNRRGHLPYVLRVLLCDSPEQVAQLIGEQCQVSAT